MTRFLNLPAAPVLLPGVGGSADPAAALRRLCRTAADRELARTAGRVVIVAAGQTTRRWDPAIAYDLGRLTGRRRTTANSRLRRPAANGLPLSLAVVRQFFARPFPAEDRGETGVILQTVAAGTTAAGREDLVNRLGIRPDDLVVAAADGSALSRPGGPDAHHPEAAEFDRAVAAAWRSGDPALLAGIDTDLADQVMATGAPVWQLVAALADGHRYRSRIDCADAPFGVFCLIAAWSRPEVGQAA